MSASSNGVPGPAAPRSLAGAAPGTATAEVAERIPYDAGLAERRIDALIDSGDLHAAADVLAEMPAWLVVDVLERSGTKDRAVMFRLLPKDAATSVFEALDPPLQSELIRDLHDSQVREIFAEMDPDDRAGLIDELPAKVATRLMRELDEDEQALTAAVLGYPVGSVGRRMSPEYVSTHPDTTAAETLERVGLRMDEAETIYALPVTDDDSWASWGCARS